MGRTLRLSRCGDCCRALAFDLAGYPRKPFDALSQARMDLGHVYAAHALSVLRAEGATVSHEEHPVQFCGVLGHIDALATWPDGRVELVEIKSGGRSSLDDFAVNGLQFARGSFLRQYYAQVQAYLHGIRIDDAPLERALIVYCQRPDGQAEALVSARQLATETGAPDPIGELDPAGCRIERGYVDRSEEAGEIVRLRLRLASRPLAHTDTELREFGLREDGSLPFECAWCDHREPCWGVLVEEKPAKNRVVRFYPQSEMEW